jgi:NAD(P)H-hydrate epimerase
MIPTPSEMQAIESAAFKRGVQAEDLMEEAGAGMARVVQRFFPKPSRAIAFCGKGHNAGDVLVVGRILARAGWQVDVDLAFPKDQLAPLTAKKLSEFQETQNGRTGFPAGPLIVLDGLLGIGSKGEPRAPISDAIDRIRNLREQAHALVFAADLPSGLNGLTGQPADCCVEADCTVTIGFCKSGLIADAATNFVGRLEVIPLSDLTAESVVDHSQVLTPDFLRTLLSPRRFDSHKGTWGRVGVIAGSEGFPGAARLCSAAAVSAGAGLVTLYVLPAAHLPLSIACVPEVMVKPVKSYSEILNDRLDGVAIGPGLGREHDEEVRHLIKTLPRPCVVDADALNAVATDPVILSRCAGPRIVTPHPVEMDRLLPGSLGTDRRTVAREFSAKYPDIALLLKGARTILAKQGAQVRYNTTGNPGMGSGGMGDALTGVVAALLARGLSPLDAGSVAAWVCGRAAEAYVFGPLGSPESLTASQVIEHLGAGFRAIVSD